MASCHTGRRSCRNTRKVWTPQKMGRRCLQRTRLCLEGGALIPLHIFLIGQRKYGFHRRYCFTLSLEAIGVSHRSQECETWVQVGAYAVRGKDALRQPRPSADELVRFTCESVYVARESSGYLDTVVRWVVLQVPLPCAADESSGQRECDLLRSSPVDHAARYFSARAGDLAHSTPQPDDCAHPPFPSPWIQRLRSIRRTLASRPPPRTERP